MLSKKARFILVLIGAVAIYQGGKLAWSEVAQSYFDTRCEEDAGEFIYRTVDNVEGLFQMRPRDPRDYFTRMREGDIPEDPYGHTNFESRVPQGLFLSSPLNRIPQKKPYSFLETIKQPNVGENYDRRFPETKVIEDVVVTGDKYWRYVHYGNVKDKGDYYIVKQTQELTSQYGYTWREIRNEQDELYGVRGGELIVKELKSDEVLGSKKGFFYKDKLTGSMSICPKGKSSTMAYDFISKVLIPVEVIDKGED